MADVYVEAIEECITNIHHIRPGKGLTLTREQAEPFLATGAMKEISASEPEPQEAGKRKRGRPKKGEAAPVIEARISAEV